MTRRKENKLSVDCPGNQRKRGLQSKALQCLPSSMQPCSPAANTRDAGCSMETLTVVSSGREAAQGVSTSPHRHGLSIPNRQHLTPPPKSLSAVRSSLLPSLQKKRPGSQASRNPRFQWVLNKPASGEAKQIPFHATQKDRKACLPVAS